MTIGDGMWKGLMEIHKDFGGFVLKYCVIFEILVGSYMTFHQVN